MITSREDDAAFREMVGETVPASDETELFALTDPGNAERLVAMHGSTIRYASGIGWLAWDGRRWAQDD